MSNIVLPAEHRYNKIIQERQNEDGSELAILNLGPTHPATHGIFQNILLMDGERIVEAEPTIGYIHRAFEKIAENRPFYQITPLTDRMNYCSSPINNMAWWMTLEKLLNIEVPKRAQYLRVIVMELARISDHIICNSILGVDTGFLYVFQYREKIYEIYEEICGARLTTNMGRIGGFERDWSPKAFEKLDAFLEEFPAVWQEFENLFTRNRIFIDRTVNVGAITAVSAMAYGFTGPNLRAAGVDYDVRVAQPYSSYEDFEFDVPAYHLPPKEDVYQDMEALIYHFKIVMGEVPVPVAEVYHPVEGGNGELGFYLITDGSRTPYRLHFRRPCFIYYQAYPEMIKGSMLSDAIVILSSLNVIAGELDA